MTRDQIRSIIKTIRTYNFMFKSTGLVNYKESRDQLMGELKEYARNLNNVHTLKVV